MNNNLLKIKTLKFLPIVVLLLICNKKSNYVAADDVFISDNIVYAVGSICEGTSETDCPTLWIDSNAQDIGSTGNFNTAKSIVYCHTVIFSDKAYNAIIDETFRKDPMETGGILLGYVLDNGFWVVMEVIPPGIDSVHHYAYFEYDEKFVNYLAESVATKYEEKLQLLGLWHRHPGSMDTFSGTDDETNRAFADIRSCGTISGLVNVDPNFRLTMRHVSNPLHYEIVDVEVGDDLIPEDYFKLRHFPKKGLNPAPNSEKTILGVLQSKSQAQPAKHHYL